MIQHIMKLYIMFERHNAQFIDVVDNEVRWTIAWVDELSQMQDKVRQDTQCYNVV